MTKIRYREEKYVKPKLKMKKKCMWFAFITSEVVRSKPHLWIENK